MKAESAYDVLIVPSWTVLTSPNHSAVDRSRGSSHRSLLRRAPDVPRVLRLSISGFGLGSVRRGSERFRIECLRICNAYD